MKLKVFVTPLNHNTLISKMPKKNEEINCKKPDSGLVQRAGFFTELFVFQNLYALLWELVFR